MRTVWKEIHRVTDGPFAVKGRPLHVEWSEQGRALMIWSLVERETQDSEPVSTRCSVFGTGHEIPDGWPVHLGTVIDHDSGFYPLVWHVFAEAAG